MIKFLVFILILFTGSQSSSQDPLVMSFGMNQGLETNEIYHIYEDHKRQIWVATNNGVYVKNGRSFQKISTKDGLPTNTVYETFEDNSGRIWFVSNTLEFSFLNDKNKIQLLKLNNKIAESLNFSLPFDKHSLVVKEDYLGFASQSNGRTFCYSDGTVSNDFNNGHLPGNYYYTEIEKPFGTTVGISSDLNIIFQDSVLFRKNFFSRYKYKYAKQNAIWHNGEFWFTKGEMLFKLERDSVALQKKFTNEIVHIESIKGNIVVAIRNNGVIEFETHSDNLKKKRQFFANYTISHICEDIEGGIWFGTLNHGLIYWPNTRAVYSDNFEKKSIRKLRTLENSQIWIQENQLWIQKEGTSESQVVVGSFVKDIELIQDFVIVSESQKTKIIDIEWSNGKCILHELYQSNDDYKKLVRINDTITAALGKRNFSLFKYEGGRLNVEKDIFQGKQITVYDISLHNGTYLIASSNGLYEYKDGFIVNSPFNYFVKNEKIVDINTEQNFLVATGDDGIYEIVENKVKLRISKASLGNESVRKIQILDQLIWVYHSNSVSCYSVDYKFIKKVDSRNGFPNSGVNDILSDSSQIIIATNKGVALLEKEFLKESTYRKPIIIKSVFLEGEYHLKSNSFKLAYNNEGFNVKYDGAPNSGGDDIVYKYSLVKDTEDLINWRATESNELEFPTLNPGSYNLLLSISDENYKFPPREINFSVESPFWKDWYFIIFLVISAVLFTILLTYTVYKIRLKNVRSRQQLKYQVFKYRQQAISRQLNPHFIFNSMNSIQNYLIKNDRINSSKYLSKFSVLMRKMLEHFDHDLVSMESEIDFITEYLGVEKMRFGEKISFSVNGMNERIASAKVPPGILQPFVENAIWHGLMPKDGNGKIVIWFENSRDIAHCFIGDDGVGRSRAQKINQQKNGNSKGVKISDERISSLNSYYNTNFSFEIRDGLDDLPFATIVKFSFPMEGLKS